MTGPAEQAALTARAARRRAIALDVCGLAAAALGVAAVVIALVLALGGLVGGLLCGGVVCAAAGVVLMRRENSVPDVLMPRAVRVPSGPGEDTAPGQPYAPARSIADGAPRSPLSGM